MGIIDKPADPIKAKISSEIENLYMKHSFGNFGNKELGSG
jgi:hypothetical protein